MQGFWVGALSPDHIRSHCRQETYSLETDGSGEGKGRLLLQAQSLPEACGNVEVEVAVMSQPILVGPESIQNISWVLALLGVDPFSKWQDDIFPQKGGFASSGYRCAHVCMRACVYVCACACACACV